MLQLHLISTDLGFMVYLIPYLSNVEIKNVYSAKQHSFVPMKTHNS